MPIEYVTLQRYNRQIPQRQRSESTDVKFRKDWLEAYVQKEFQQTLDEFLSDYTWDVVEPIERDYETWNKAGRDKHANT